MGFSDDGDVEAVLGSQTRWIPKFCSRFEGFRQGGNANFGGGFREEEKGAFRSLFLIWLCSNLNAVGSIRSVRHRSVREVRCLSIHWMGDLLKDFERENRRLTAVAFFGTGNWQPSICSITRITGFIFLFLLLSTEEGALEC